MDLWQSNEGFTHVKEAAGMLQYELTGVWFVLTVIYINVELISLETEEDRMFTLPYLIIYRSQRSEVKGNMF